MNNALFILFLPFLTTVGFVTTDIYLPSLPAITHYFHTSNTMAQLTLPAYLLTFALSPLLLGPYSDTVGRKKVIVSGLLLSVLSTILCIVATDIHWLILGRALQGIGLGGVRTCSNSMIPDCYKGEALAKISALMGMIWPMILAISPLLGGWLQQAYHWQAVFIALFTYQIILLLLVFFFLPETNKHLHDLNLKSVGASYLQLLRNKTFMIFAWMIAIIPIGTSAYMTVSPYLFQVTLGLTPRQYGAIAIPVCALILLCGAINARLVGKLKPSTLILVAIGFMLTSSASLLLIHVTGMMTVTTVILACLLFFPSISFAFPSAYAQAYKTLKGGYGTAVAIIGSLQMLLAALSSFIASILPENTVLSMVGLFAVSGVLAIIFLAIAMKQKQKLDSQ